MPTTITIDPVTRIEGHLEVRVTVDMVDGEQRVIDTHSAGTMFRGFEMILAGRDPRDAAQYTQRICGVCPVSHALAACINLDSAFGVTIPENARILRNLILGANYIQSHLLHFYHLTALDYIDTTGLLEGSPWTPRNVTADMLTGQEAADLVQHYLDALRIRRKAHQMGAVFGGKLPCTGSFVVGGITETVTADRIAAFRALLGELRAFVDNVYLPDVNLIGARFPEYYQRGVGTGNLIAFGVFDQNGDGSSKLLPGGRRTDGVAQSVDPAEITEHVTHSWFTSACDNKNPAQGETIPDVDKEGAYSWVKAPRYAGRPHETGPIARMWISNHYSNGTSVIDRTIARATETKVVADAMDGWLDELVVGGPVRAPSEIPTQATSMGLTEAPRGALGHWMDIENSVINRYQVVTPTSWNASPRDHLNQLGPVEDALMGTPVADLSQPVEVLRIVHSFDPCLACAVHLVRPDDRTGGTRVLVRPGSPDCVAREIDGGGSAKADTQVRERGRHLESAAAGRPAGRPPAKAPPVRPTLVLGVGNILLRDEGIGVRAVEAMQKMELPRTVELFDGATAGLDLLDVLAGRERVIIIDAADANELPGTVMRMQLGDLAASDLARASLHDFGVLETLSVARRMGIAPGEVVVLGVVPKNIQCGLALSPEVERSIPALIECVLGELNGRQPD